MPKLDTKTVHAYWNEYRDPMIYRVISFMESVEDWTIDGDEALEEALERLGKALDEVKNVDLQNEDAFVNAAAYIKAGRMLRLLQGMDTANPGAASQLLTHAEESTNQNDDVFGLFLRRNIVFERLRLLARVFSPHRMAMVLKALEEDHE